MALREIITPENPVLRKKAFKVTNFNDPKLQTLIDDMVETMLDAPGVGLAAPQVGVLGAAVGQAGSVMATEAVKVITGIGEPLLGQFLATAVHNMARAANMAPGLVGSVEDVRDLIAYHLGHGGQEVPILAQGWRSEVVGQVVSRLLDGELAVRIRDPNSQEPLSFEPAGRV